MTFVGWLELINSKICSSTIIDTIFQNMFNTKVPFLKHLKGLYIWLWNTIQIQNNKNSCTIHFKTFEYILMPIKLFVWPECEFQIVLQTISNGDSQESHEFWILMCSNVFILYAILHFLLVFLINSFMVFFLDRKIYELYDRQSKKH